MRIVMKTVGLKAEIKELSLLLTVDWLLDRIRTSVNVLGDGFGAGIIHHLCKDTLVEADTDDLIRQIREDIKELNRKPVEAMVRSMATPMAIPLHSFRDLEEAAKEGKEGRVALNVRGAAGPSSDSERTSLSPSAQFIV